MLSPHQPNTLVQALHLPPGRKCCPMNYRHTTQAAGLPFAISTADREETASRSLPHRKMLGRGAGRKQLLKHTSYQHGRSFLHWWQLFLGNSPPAEWDQAWTVGGGSVLNAKNCLGGHSLTREEWGGESEVTIFSVLLMISLKSIRDHACKAKWTLLFLPHHATHHLQHPNRC